MGLLIEGKWSTEWYETNLSNGEFIRQDAQFRRQVGEGRLMVEEGRYHLFVSLACPWAHRALIFRKLKNLEKVINVSVVRAEMLDGGWEIDDGMSVSLGYQVSPIEKIKFLHEVYCSAKSDYTGRVTVPVLWDKKTSTIVNNESSEIIRILNSAFDEFSDMKTDFYPRHLRSRIDEINNPIYDDINNGVYRAGFATTQEAYEKSYRQLFKSLDFLEDRLARQRYLVGNHITEADWRLFTTLIRFDMVYYSHFKTNKRRIEDFPNLSNYVRELYQYDGISETVNFEHIKTHYYYSHETINPTRVIPAGPEIDFDRPHNRAAIGKQVG